MVISAIKFGLLEEKGYIDKHGRITDKFTPEKPGFQMELPEPFQPISSAIIDEMKRHIFKDRIVNARERRTLKYNKQIELNEDFKILWEKISKKTRYFVEFETKDLIRNAIAKISKMDFIRPVSILIDKTEIVEQHGHATAVSMLMQKAFVHLF